MALVSLSHQMLEVYFLIDRDVRKTINLHEISVVMLSTFYMNLHERERERARERGRDRERDFLML